MWMFAFLGVYLHAMSAHKLISEGRGVLLLHTAVISRDVGLPPRPNVAWVSLSARPRGLVPAPVSAAGSGAGACRSAPAPLHPSCPLLSSAPAAFLPPKAGGTGKCSSSYKEGKGGRRGKGRAGRKEGWWGLNGGTADPIWMRLWSSPILRKSPIST